MHLAHEQKAFGIFQLVVFVLSIYALLALLVDMVFPLKPEASRLIQIFDNVICAIFFWDFIRQFREAENKLKFMRLGWIDLLACIPTIDLLRWGRLVRVFRIIRLIRTIRGTHKIFAGLRTRQAMSGSLALAAFLLVIFGSLLILSCETSERSNIKTEGDALWWTITTVTTVGYGDFYPVTAAGRLVAAILMVGGVGMFGSLTALIASSFSAAPDPAAVRDDLKALRQEVMNLRHEIAARSGDAIAPRSMP